MMVRIRKRKKEYVLVSIYDLIANSWESFFCRSRNFFVHYSRGQFLEVQFFRMFLYLMISFKFNLIAMASIPRGSKQSLELRGFMFQAKSGQKYQTL